MRRNPSIGEDVGNLTLIAVSACAAGLATLGVLLAEDDPEVTFRYEARPASSVPSDFVDEAPRLSDNRLYGTVTLRGGDRHSGFIRWDRNEASWADVLDATKASHGRLTGVRFGHVDRIDVTGRGSAVFTLKSGETVELEAHATDLGTGMRALLIDDPSQGSVELQWGDLERVDFEAAPAGLQPREGRIYGTLTTTGGLALTGYVTWDVDEVYSSDMLDGDVDGERISVPFGAIASIVRNGSGSARVTLRDGREMTMRGTNDVDSSIRGIAVSDPALGEVKMGWSEFEEVRFHEPEAEVGYDAFDGGREMRGTVVTEDGEELSGRIRWDGDEAFTWEPLNGSVHDDVEVQIELANVARIVREGAGATVTLRDGRRFELTGSNDVDSRNDGVFVEDGSGERRRIRWSDFRELRLES